MDRGADESPRRDVSSCGRRRHAHAHRFDADLRGTGAALRRLAGDDRRQAPPRREVPQDREVRAAQPRAPGVGGRPCTSTSSITCATRHSRRPAATPSCAGSSAASWGNSSTATAPSGSSGWWRVSTTASGRSCRKSTTAWWMASPAQSSSRVVLDAEPDPPRPEPAPWYPAGSPSKSLARLEAVGAMAVSPFEQMRAVRAGHPRSPPRRGAASPGRAGRCRPCRADPPDRGLQPERPDRTASALRLGHDLGRRHQARAQRPRRLVQRCRAGGHHRRLSYVARITR